MVVWNHKLQRFFFFLFPPDDVYPNKQTRFPQIRLKSERLPLEPFLFLCSSSHESCGNPSQGVIIRPVSRPSPVVAGPWCCPVHNTALGRPSPAWNPSILSIQSALFQQELSSSVTEGFSQTSGAFQEKGREKISLGENKVWEQFWSGLQINVVFWVHFGYRSVSRQSVVRTCLLQSQDCCAIDVLDSNIRHSAIPVFFFLSLTPTNLFPFPVFHKGQRNSEKFPLQQGSDQLDQRCQWRSGFPERRLRPSFKSSALSPPTTCTPPSSVRTYKLCLQSCQPAREYICTLSAILFACVGVSCWVCLLEWVSCEDTPVKGWRPSLTCNAGARGVMSERIKTQRDLWQWESDKHRWCPRSEGFPTQTKNQCVYITYSSWLKLKAPSFLSSSLNTFWSCSTSSRFLC